MKIQMFGNISYPRGMVIYLIRMYQFRICTSWAYIFFLGGICQYIAKKICNNSDNHKTCQRLEIWFLQRTPADNMVGVHQARAYTLFNFHLSQVPPRGPELLRTSDHRTCCQNLSQYTGSRRIWKAEIVLEKKTLVFSWFYWINLSMTKLIT